LILKTGVHDASKQTREIEMKLQFAGALLLATMAVTAVAGDKVTHEVTFDTTKPFARGNLGDARNSVDAVQYIGCTITGSAGSCIAVNSAGVVHSCTTTDPGMMSAIGAINGDSYVVFRWDGATGLCTTVQVSNYSQYAPK